MHANTVAAKQVTIGTTGEVVSSANVNKVWTILQSAPGNAQRIYLGGSASVTSSTGAPSIAADKAVTVVGSAQVAAVAGGAGQVLLVLEGFR